MVVWEFFVNLIEIFLFYVLINIKLRVNNSCKNVKLKQLVFLSCRLLSLNIMNVLGVPAIITISVSCCMEILFSVLFYEGLLTTRIFWGCTYTGICIIAEFIPFFVINIFSDISMLEGLLDGVLRIPITILYLSIITIMVFGMRFLSRDNIIFKPTQKFYYALISVIGIVVGHFSLLNIIELEEKMPNSLISLHFMTSTFCFLFLFLILLIYIYQLGVSNARNNELMELQKNYELDKREYQNLIETTKHLREMKHDIQNHLEVMQLLAIEEPAKLPAYISGFNATVDSPHKFVSTGNTAIDCIVSAKLAKANKYEIKVEYSLIVPEVFPIDVISTSSLLGNLWDNAIEGVLAYMKGTLLVNPFINFYIKPYRDMLAIHIDNSYNGEKIKLRNGLPISSKEGIGHGIGMKRVLEIVSKANGMMHLDFSENVFTVHILIPNKE